MPLTKHRLALAAATVVAVILGPAAAASASTTTTSSGCAISSVAQVFKQFGDSAEYTLAPDGAFQSGTAGWTIEGNAKLVADSEPYGIGVSGGQALEMNPLSVAISPPLCVSSAQPTFRYLVKNGSPIGNVTTGVDLLSAFSGALSNLFSWATVTTHMAWSASPANPLATVIPLLSNGSATVRLVFTDLTGTETIGDIYVDPWAR